MIKACWLMGIVVIKTTTEQCPILALVVMVNVFQREPEKSQALSSSDMYNITGRIREPLNGQNRMYRFYLIACGVILFCSSLVKIISAFGSARILERSDSILTFFTERQTLIFGGLVELLVVLSLAFLKSVNARLFLLFWMGSQFLLYHFGMNGAPQPCPCLGRASAWLHIQDSALNKFSIALASFIFLGAVFLLMRRYVTCRFTTKTSC